MNVALRAYAGSCFWELSWARQGLYVGQEDRKYTKTLVLTNLLVFSAVGLFWLTLPSGITSLDRLTTYIPPGESVGFLDGVVVGRAGLVRDEERWRKDAKAEKREYP